MNLRVTAKTLEKSTAESDIRLKATIYIYIAKSERGKRYVSKKAALSMSEKSCKACGISAVNSKYRRVSFRNSTQKALAKK